MTELYFDTCFLIDLEREKKRGEGRAHAFLAANLEKSPAIPWIVAGEFADGFGDIDHPVCARMLSAFAILSFGKPVAQAYARIAGTLRRTGRSSAPTASGSRRMPSSMTFRWSLTIRQTSGAWKVCASSNTESTSKGGVNVLLLNQICTAWPNASPVASWMASESVG